MSSNSSDFKSALRKFLEEKISQLRRELEFYEYMLEILEESESQLEFMAVNERRVKDSSGNDVAVIKIGEKSVRIIPLIEIPASHPKVRYFLMRFLSELKPPGSTASPKYSIRTRNGLIAEIIIEGPIPNYLLRQLEAALIYAFSRA